jgi:outer membrane protein TolC
MVYRDDRRHSGGAGVLAITAAGILVFKHAAFEQGAAAIPDPKHGPALPSPAASVGSAAAGTTVWDISKTIAAALASSTDFANALRSVEIDWKHADEVGAAARPNASLSGSATGFDPATRVTFDSSTLKVLGDSTQTLAVDLSDRLDITGKVQSQVDQVKLQCQADIYEAQRIRNSRIRRAQTIFYNILRARHQVSVAQSSLTNSETQLATAKSVNAGGVGQKIDLLRATTQVAEAQQTLIQAVNSAAVAEASFNDLVRQPLKTPVAVQAVPGAAVGTTITGATSVGAPTPGHDALHSSDGRSWQDRPRFEHADGRYHPTGDPEGADPVIGRQAGDPSGACRSRASL